MLLAVIRDAGLDMAQPAHDLGSHFSHGINVRRPGALARLTDFVEIGPLIAIGPGIRNRVIPFDEQRPMGWGLELQWSALAGEGFRLGVVDAVAVEHIDPVGEGYDSAEARRKLNAELRRRGLHDVSDVARDRGTWWAGTRAAPWLRPGGRA